MIFSLNRKIEVKAIFFVLFPFALFASNDTIVLNNKEEIINVSSGLLIYEDKSSQLSVNEVLKIDSFVFHQQRVPNLGLSTSSFFVKLTVTNSCIDENLLLVLSNPLIDFIEFYEVREKKVYLISTVGDEFLYRKRKYNHQRA